MNYYVKKSHSEKFKGKCTMKNERCKWEIMASYWKKTRMRMIKKYSGPHTFIAMSSSQDHLMLDSDMIANIILFMVLDFYVPSFVTDLETRLKYYDDQLVPRKRVSHWFFWTFEQCSSTASIWFKLTEDTRPDQEMSGASYSADLMKGTYDCERFKAFQFSYTNAITAFGNIKIDYATYINYVCRL
ncbi:hypothetical protein PVK06_043346 [Gossypium arboreum]|uniref:Transposase MuDR plant domain-containing protein n=1 Tax=Gossypium arboreum TaxID=29729 RepID=A0ABR0MN88_GOSAR|nr:hypothetical protein PVK06_043346 [Gossypium arboreum]